MDAQNPPSPEIDSPQDVSPRSTLSGMYTRDVYLNYAYYINILEDAYGC